MTTNPAFSNPANRNRLNDADRGVIAAPTLGDLDNPPDGKLEILVSALDGYLYAWSANGVPRPGFPVRIADPAKVDIDPATGVATPLPGMDVRERGRKLLGSPAIGDLDGDGNPEIVVTSNEEYGNEDPIFTPDPSSTLTGALLTLGGSLGGFSLDVQGRIYAVHNDGNLHAGGPFRTGWPARVPTLVSGLLPTVATGTPGSAALADLDGPGPNTELTVAIFGSGGPVVLLKPDGTSFLGTGPNGPFALATDFAEGFPNLPSTTDAVDAPFFAALGSGAFGDMTGDGVPEYVAPLAGIRELLDVSAPASQEPGSHMIGAFDPQSGDILPGFPRNMDDMQFLTSPAIADVSGDGQRRDRPGQRRLPAARLRRRRLAADRVAEVHARLARRLARAGRHRRRRSHRDRRRDARGQPLRLGDAGAGDSGQRPVAGLRRRSPELEELVRGPGDAHGRLEGVEKVPGTFSTPAPPRHVRSVRAILPPSRPRGDS